MYKIHLLGLTGMNYGNANTLEIELTGELKAMNFVKEKLKEKKDSVTFFDVGANIGSYSSSLRSVFKNPQLKIFAFEPSHGTYLKLLENSMDNTDIKMFNFGFGKNEETLNIFYHYQASGATTLYNQGLESFSEKDLISEEIKISTIDLFCNENKISEIDFLKIDVEGHEFPVLIGAKEMLGLKKIKFIQFEFGSFHVHSRTFFKDFWDLLNKDYIIYRIISDGLFEIKNYTENLEIFRTSNFLAELKN